MSASRRVLRSPVPEEPAPNPDEKLPKEESFAEIWARFITYVRRLGPASVLAAIATFLPILGTIILIANINTVGEYLRERQPASLALYSIAFAVLAGLAFVPTHSSAFVGGWAFGLAIGFPAALAGFLGGSLIGYAIARPTASSRVEALIAEKPKWKAVHDALVRGSPWRTLAIVTLLRVPPSSPFALTNMVLASVRVPILIYTIGTLLGMTPRTAVIVYLASTLQNAALDESAEKKPVWLIVVGIVASLVVLGIIVVIANKALKRLTSEHKEPTNSTP